MMCCPFVVFCEKLQTKKDLNKQNNLQMITDDRREKKPQRKFIIGQTKRPAANEISLVASQSESAFKDSEIKSKDNRCEIFSIVFALFFVALLLLSFLSAVNWWE